MKLDIVLPKSLIMLNTAIKQKGGQLFVVGGYVRNSLLGLKTYDIDICGTLNPSDIRAVFKTNGFNAITINKKLGTVLITHGADEYEYTTFRKENYNQGGTHSPTDVEFVTDIFTDANRRDFTINSLYLSVDDLNITDFFGGLNDLKKRQVKCIVNPKVVFNSDGLRLLRFIRFACELDFAFDKASKKVAKENVHLLNDISKERVLKELKDIVNADSKYNIYTNQHERVITIFNEFNIYKYLFNSSFDRFLVTKKSSLYSAYTKTSLQNRYYAFIILVVFQKLVSVKDKQSIEFLVETMLGANGLKESRENINKIIKLAFFVNQLLHASSANVELVVKYNEFAYESHSYFKNINSELVAAIERLKQEMVTESIPLNIGELKIKSSDFINSKIPAHNITKIKVALFNECLEKKTKNEKLALIKRAKELSEHFK